ncbi:hypothetical protein PR202_gb21105 [Eleusine coracana subsp. coracana]|uniref:Glucan endo-1,3-beta-D-glucosidase n=1 Tax=Eleusine coracana subsp. coracana TaxID=191504 RepID=A0AAV5FCE2_ELECO|nr:hypothetical protein PR202_gb21105 [Eleusine coracana subsp. coracana]
MEARIGGQAATPVNAQAYNNNLINRMLSDNTATPHRPNADMDIYIFALFNKNQKGLGPNVVEQNFGLFYSNMTKVYEFAFHDGGGTTEESWCATNAAVGDARLKAVIDFTDRILPAAMEVLPRRKNTNFE